MKKYLSKTCILLAALLFISTADAQVSTYERTPGYYTFGINGGVAFQQADIQTTFEGYGLGMTLAKNLYYQPGAFLSFDVRGRALYSQTKGQDYMRSYGIYDNDALNGNLNLDYIKETGGPGFVFQNNKTDHAELAIEGVINFNKLREQTNVNLSLFGGIGLDWYNVKTDQADRNGSYAVDYLGIDTLGSISYTKDLLKRQILDGKYETNVFENNTGKLGIMPSLGVELGYQFTPRFSMGIGHKVTFTKTDLFDGHQWRNNGNLTAEDDIHHYTNLHLRWIIDDNSKKLREPLVDITSPSLSPHTSRTPTYDIRATVKHIKSSMDIQFNVNGERNSFNYRKGDFKSLIRLRPGNNEVVITASNSVGSATDYVNIYYEAPIIDDRPTYEYPTVEITNPPYDDYRTDEARFNVRAEVRNVNSQRDIEFTVNGRNISNFDFRGGSVNALVDLREGRNTIRIGARNSDGFDSDETTIILENQITNRPPSVNITKPSVDPYETTIRKVTIEAKVYNIENKRDIRFTIDGYDSNDFTFSNNVFCANVNVNKYRTEVVVSASNNAGQDSDNVTILWEEEIEPTIEKPVVTITSTSQPTVDPFDPTNCRSTIIATVLNVEDHNNIDVYLNGQHVTNYDFNSNTQVLQTTVRLAQGTNTIRIVATNNAGSDEDSSTTQGCNVNTDKKPPVVTIELPRNNTTTNEPTIGLIAEVLNVSTKNDINVFVNGRRFRNFSFSGNEVKATLTLENGNNVIRVVASNNDGTDEASVNVKYNLPVAKLPTVNITIPNDNTTVEISNARIAATILNVINKSSITFTVNGKQSTGFNFQRGQFTADIKLNEGRNTVLITARNADGQAEDQVIINYKRPQVLPKVTIERPINNSTTDKATTGLIATVLNVSTKNDIEVFVNGRRFKNFSFSRNEVKATLTLENGNNVIRVVASNNDGTDEANVNIKYNLPVAKLPTVNITIPNDNTTVEISNARIAATILNVINKSSITFTVNGKQSTGFNFQRGQFTADIKLNEGRNTVLITARNADGQAEDQVIINYKRTQVLPKVTIERPINNSTTDKATTNLIATVLNVSTKNDINVFVNGRRFKNFSFSRNEVKATLSLENGNNVIRVVASNNDGTDEASVNVKYNLPVAKLPTVNITSPRNNQVFAQTKAALTATITEVSSKRAITLSVNGKLQDFNYNRGKLTADVILKVGRNNITVKATNKDGSDQASITLVHTPKVNIPQPEVKFTSPATAGTTTENAKFRLKAAVKNVQDKKAITVKLNGRVIKKFDFNPRSNEVSATITLSEGKNLLFIEATNASGKDSNQASVKLENVVVVKYPPKVTITSVSDPTVDPFNPDKAKSTLIAKTENIASKRGIVFTYNGRKITNYTFNKSTGIIQITVDLKKGKNTFNIKVSNNDGSDEANRDLQFGSSSTSTGSTGNINSRNGTPAKDVKSKGTISRNSRRGQ